MSKTMVFKTSMKCAGCVATATPNLNALAEVESWKADVSGPVKTLSVEAEEIFEPKIVAALAKAGFTAERIS